MRFKLSETDLKRFEKLYVNYKKLHLDPGNCDPMVIINTPVENAPSWEERLADPMVMLQGELDALHTHMVLQDDRVPSIRVQFGTAQVAAAFGCEMFQPDNSLPCAGNHILKKAQDVYALKKPSFQSGWYDRLEEWTEIFKRNIPEGVHIQHPDIQSPFNSAHLIRGNDILLDIYDDPEAFGALLDVVTDYMIDLTRWLKNMVSTDKEWFFDWGAMWKGAARISNCSTHMISPQMYHDYVLERDMRFMKAMGGGRVHYCGTSGKIIDEFFNNADVYGLDYDSQYHDLWQLSEKAPEKFVLLNAYYNQEDYEQQETFIKRLEHEGWPKRNVIVQLWAPNLDEGKTLLNRMKKTIIK
ncbi:hypothetical protein HZI73_16410 [Vallitalea pronyensis]|uniref:Uroporphyrinogen decarboxylase (URO-D) domain-containing protein n=1 Tax=Vallitalea pronyensis TaxID=1348613 RepID=A0A8J8MLL3_9FIRM|nr:uroporphyrinogen decarboxylase family protein [Vallitalea pronyensis]QUI23776.1 hypothetical protein HZI73_16410 [Vallitalea pronyensis]